jgi:hypothetical protein
MMTSWAVAAFSTWAELWKQEETVIQTMNHDKAQRMINYADQLLRHRDPGLSLTPHQKAERFLNGGRTAAHSAQFQEGQTPFALFTRAYLSWMKLRA